jgi:hypothetical protein
MGREIDDERSGGEYCDHRRGQRHQVRQETEAAHGLSRWPRVCMRRDL